ncbi:hypothetical protein B0A55_12407 [Friedmanniomyces simplex]|uniref:TauD/TfdA-like domain-containing protein n=1 Tax=Friedmanniomyces simplex TaxID=329884 RepID=A0A4U0WFE9_9PEZI|nr:hypothetical protein B0A55_12407 [Friedmanniomyces simplex]
MAIAMAIKSRITVHKITPPKDSTVDFGAELRNANLEDISEVDFSVIRRALYEHQVIIFKGQQSLSPKAQYELTRLFDPSVQAYGHGKTLDAKKSILHPDLKTIPHQPQVQVIGNGHVAEFEGLLDITLKHPHHKTFHQHPISEADDRDNTRFYPLAHRCCATLRYDDGTGDELAVPRGSTAFVSSYRMYDLLSVEYKVLARTTRVQYAPHPYIWMSKAKSRSDGLGLVSEGLELPHLELPPIDDSKIKILPMCWRNPVTGKLALQVHPSAVEKLHLVDGTVIDNLEQVREIVHKLQRPGIAPELVYAVDWEAGDLALFHNQGVLHSVTGSFAPDEHDGSAMYTSAPRPVPSPAALKALRQLAYISSGTAIGFATLCAEERRRRTQIVQKIADNARRIRQSPRYYQNVALATQEAEDGLVRGWGGVDWTPEYTEALDKQGDGSRSKRAVVKDEAPAIRGPELPSSVDRGYAQLEEQCKRDEEGRKKKKRPRSRAKVKQSPTSAESQPRRTVQSHAHWRTDDVARQRVHAEMPAVHDRPAEHLVLIPPGPKSHWTDSPSWLPQLPSCKEEAPRPLKDARPATTRIAAAAQKLNNAARIQPHNPPRDIRSASNVKKGGKAAPDSTSLQTQCRALLSSSQFNPIFELLRTHSSVVIGSSQGKALLDECLHAALATGEVSAMRRTLQLAEKLLPKDDYLPLCVLFLQYCDEKGIYDEALELYARNRKLQKSVNLGSKTSEILAYACIKSTKPHYLLYFTKLFRSVPVDMRGRITDSWSPLPLVLVAEWRASRDLVKFGKGFKRLRLVFREGGHTEALRRLEMTAVDIYVSANAHDQALNAVADLHAASPHDAFTISVTALLLAKKGDWNSLGQALAVGKQSSTLALDAEANRRFNTTLHLYAKCHSSTETWKFVTALVDDLGFRPNQSTTEIMLQSFISKNTIYLIPKWIRYIRILGERFRLDAQLATKLLTRYYRDYRPSHVLLMWFCRHLVQVAPSLAGQEYLPLAKEAIGFDLRSLTGEHNRNTSWRRSHAEARLGLLEGTEHNMVPSPGWTWNQQMHFVHPNAAPVSVPSERKALVTSSLQFDNELPSMIQIDDPRPLPEECVTASETASDGEGVQTSDPAAQAIEAALIRPERAMVLALSLQDHQKVLYLYHRSLDAGGLPASPFALEVAVEASLRQGGGDPTQANALLREAKNAGMNITGAMGPMLIHRMKRIRWGDRGDLDGLHETVTEYYQVNDENGLPVNHHVGVTAAHMLIKNNRPEQGVALLKAMYQSGRALKRPPDAVAMAVLIHGYFAIGSFVGLRWSFGTVLKQNIRIDQRFLHTVRAITSQHGESLFRFTAKGERSFRQSLVRWVQQCYERRASQMLEAKVLGRRLVARLAKCARELERPVIAVPERGEIEDALFGRRMLPLSVSTDGDDVDHVADEDAADEEGADEEAADEDSADEDSSTTTTRRRLRRLSRMKVRLGDSIQSHYPHARRTPAPRRAFSQHYHGRWLRQYRAYLKHDLAMPDGSLASFRFRLADDPRDSLAGRRRRKAGRHRGGGGLVHGSGGGGTATKLL